MTTTSPAFNKTIAAIFLSSALLVGTAKAQIASHSKDIVIEQCIRFFQGKAFSVSENAQRRLIRSERPI